ncbi:hypothetical protein GCM10010430_48350 [Kitasatospora cystarginea]|uniref:DUF397 domain-containing protein n=1 Tax=Kitasatospora cystarginea TaxID=58350 RepID=A0ABP5RDK6_9ACTN
MFTADGVMPPDGPKAVLAVLGAFHSDVKGKEGSIDPSRTYSTEFVSRAG